ncbi:MAG: hypothetical protein ACI81T_000389 [Bacteroidia bacterium]|jgi:hypothetical protein
MLTQSVKSDLKKKQPIQQAFGAWESEESAEDLIKQLRTERNVNREIEKL